MFFERLAIPDVFIIKPKIIEDFRGYFCESFRIDLLEKFIGNKINFFQENQSKSNYGVLRGLHFQLNPSAQTKLVSVDYGKILDVAVDIRSNSPTFGKHVSVEISDQNKLQIFIPTGFAHGFIVLSKSATVSYKVDNYFNPNVERGILFNDNNLNIDWKIPEKDIKVSQKDLLNKKFVESEYFKL